MATRGDCDPATYFAPQWYLARHPDVAASGLDPLVHYREQGWREGRDPHPLFQVRWYLDRHPDVAAAGVEPLSHYVTQGWREGRSPHPSFDGPRYLGENPDVAAAGLEPLAHFLDAGRGEGRRPTPVDADAPPLPDDVPPRCAPAGADVGPPVVVERGRQGWCPICERPTTFTAHGPWLRDDYRCGHCRSLPRERALMEVLAARFPDWRGLRIHESSPACRGLSGKLAAECAGYVASQFDPSIPCGSRHPTAGHRSEDLERLSFPSASFDVVVTQDVFEHVFDADAAFREVQRTLRPGGAHIFTVPLVRGQEASRRRAERDGSGVRHLQPPEYHGNPMSADGSLVTWDWGRDIVERIHEATGDEAMRVVLEIPALGIVAEYLDVIVVERSSPSVGPRERRDAPHRAAEVPADPSPPRLTPALVRRGRAGHSPFPGSASVR